MTSAARFLCPTCGALFGEDATRGAARCDYCGRRAALAEPERSATRQVIRPAIERSEALLALRRTLLAENVLPRSLRADVQPVEARLVYVPYHVARGLRTGIVERKPEPRTSYETLTNRDGTRETVTVRKEPVPTDDRARVLLTDVERSAPAVRRGGWGLDAIGPGALIGAGAELVPFDAEEVRRTGSVLAPDVDPSELVERLRGETARGETRLHLPTVRTVLVPFWRIRYRIGPGLYDATLDAVTGRLLAARAPENDRHRVPLAFGALGLATLCVGGVFRFLAPLVTRPADARASSSGSLNVAFYLLLLVLVVLGVFASYAWNVVRYDADRIFENGQLRGEYLNRPPSTGLDRFWDRLFGGVGKVFDAGRRRHDA
ncbi:MAG: hypothetical protein HY825_16935 [Acidobacteria bacterium]|nr:hypothetical protein [Acidobacteriota bacterium]